MDCSVGIEINCLLNGISGKNIIGNNCSGVPPFGKTLSCIAIITAFLDIANKKFTF